MFNKESVSVKKEGILNNLELHWNNEPARHKLLDVVGDLALAGKPIRGKIIASRPGHPSNVEFAKRIKAFYKTKKNTVDVPRYDHTAEPVYDINQIIKMLPHRYPFLLVDKIIDMGENHIVGLKCNI